MKRIVALLGTAILAGTLAGTAFAGDAGVTPAQIEAAKTPADHEAIAAAYDREAARLEALSKEHEQMAKAYSAAASTQKGMNAAAMTTHCKKLSKDYATAAAENRELAKEHRAMK